MDNSIDPEHIRNMHKALSQVYSPGMEAQLARLSESMKQVYSPEMEAQLARLGESMKQVYSPQLEAQLVKLGDSVGRLYSPQFEEQFAKLAESVSQIYTPQLQAQLAEAYQNVDLLSGIARAWESVPREPSDEPAGQDSGLLVQSPEETALADAVDEVFGVRPPLFDDESLDAAGAVIDQATDDVGIAKNKDFLANDSRLAAGFGTVVAQVAAARNWTTEKAEQVLTFLITTEVGVHWSFIVGFDTFPQFLTNATAATILLPGIHRISRVLLNGRKRGGEDVDVPEAE